VKDQLKGAASASYQLNISETSVKDQLTGVASASYQLNISKTSLKDQLTFSQLSNAQSAASGQLALECSQGLFLAKKALSPDNWRRPQPVSAVRRTMSDAWRKPRL
jgi:hypothetical protein